MSELVITAANFILQPVANLRDGPVILRWAYNRAFLDSDGVQVFAGTQNSGFGIEVACSVANGLINVDEDSLLWTTDNAQDPAPGSIWISAWLLNPRRVLIAQLTIAGKTQFVVTESLTPSCTWEAFSNYNQADVLFQSLPNSYYTAAETNRVIDQSFDTHPASDTQLGTVLLTVPADIPAFPVVWSANDPLVRDAVDLQGVPISSIPPLDSQVLAYNQANNQWEPSNQAAGTGNVISNEVSSIDGNVALASGTGGKTIKFDAAAHFDGSGLLTGATVDDPNADLDIANKEFVLQSVAAAVQQTPNISALIQGGTVFWESDYDFRVSAATYLILGDLFTSTEQTISLDAADPTLDRIDVIALDVAGAVVKIAGVAAAQPSQPAVDPGTQLLLTFVFVGAATTAPTGVSNTDIYLDNAEWTATTSGSGWNVNSTNNPHSGTKCIEGTNVANAAYVQLQAPAPLTLDSFAILTAFVSSKASWPKQRSLIFQWYSSGVAVGAAVTLNTGFFGFNSATASYQLVAIPIAQFAIPAGTSINQLRITDKGGAIGMFIDDLVLQANGSSIGNPPSGGLTQDQADARYLQRDLNLSDTTAPTTALNNILPSQVGNSGKFLSTNGTNPSWQTSGAGSSVPATVQGDTLFASAVNTLAALAKDTNATRYLSNTGTSNNPAWAQVNAANGVTGVLPSTNGGAGTVNGIVKANGSGTTSVAAAGTDYVAPGGALGTPSSGTLTNCTGLPVSSGISGLGSNVATFLATPSSANLAAALTDETGTGANVFADSPTFTSKVNLPNSTAPSTTAAADTAFDTNAWASGRGAMQVHDGTANTYVVAALASDVPTNGQVPTWNTGGTITWETPSTGGSPGGSNTQVQYNNSGAFGGISNATSDGTNLTLTTPKIVTRINDTNGNPLIDFTATGSAVNGLSVTNGVTGSPGQVTLGTAGSDTSIDLVLAPKGTGFILTSNSHVYGVTVVGTVKAHLGSTGLFVSTAGGGVNWTNSSASTGTIDTGLARNAAGIVEVNNGSSTAYRWLKKAGQVRVTAQFDKTNTTLADVTGTSVALLSGQTYAFEFEANYDADVTGGQKWAIAYSSTTSAIEFYILSICDSSGLNVISARQTASGNSSTQAGCTAGHIRITGTLTTTGAGNLTVQFAQSAASGTSSVRTAGSFFNVWPTTN